MEIADALKNGRNSIERKKKERRRGLKAASATASAKVSASRQERSLECVSATQLEAQHDHHDDRDDH